MENDVKQRVLEVLSRFDSNPTKLSKSESALKYGAKQTTLNGQLSKNKETPISLNTIMLILEEFKQVSAKWLLTGEGEMITTCDADNDLLIGNQSLQARQKDIEYKPYFDIYLAAGKLTDMMNGVRVEDCEYYPSVPYLPHYDFTMQVSGRSMENYIRSGDIVACRFFKDMSFIQWGNVHVLNTSQGVVIKAIYDDGDSIRCHSFNTEEFPDYLIPKSEIFSLCTVVGLIRKIY